MRILFVVPYVPSLVRARSYNLIRSLSARGHRVTVATVWSGQLDMPRLDALRAMCHDVRAVRLPAWRSLASCVWALGGSDPLQAWYSWSPELAGQITTLQADADVLHVEHLRGARYGLHALSQGAHHRLPIVWDSVDCIAYLFEQAIRERFDVAGRLVNRLELVRTRRYEGRIAGRFDRVVITSELDRMALLTAMRDEAPGRDHGSTVSVVPNGVDTTYFSPSDLARRPATLVFSGKMSYHANVAAARHLVADIMPRVWARMPDVELTIVGQDPPRTVRDLAAAHGSRVVVTGTVPDVRPFIRTASVAVIPLVYGAGSQFKVLEAMACETPVVASPRAVAALQARAGRELLVADGPERFADAVVSLLASVDRQREMGRAGRAYVEAHHQWDRIAARLEQVYDEVLSARGARSLERIAG